MLISVVIFALGAHKAQDWEYRDVLYRAARVGNCWLYLWMKMKQLLSTETVCFEVQHSHKTLYSLFLCQMGIICYPFYAPLHPLSLLQQSAETSESYLIYLLPQKHHNPFEHEKTVQIRVSLCSFLYRIVEVSRRLWLWSVALFSMTCPGVAVISTYCKLLCHMWWSFSASSLMCR